MCSRATGRSSFSPNPQPWMEATSCASVARSSSVYRDAQIGTGIDQLRGLLGPYGYQVQPVAVSGCLHLKSACSYVGNNTILVNRSWIDAEPLSGFELLDVPEEEPAAANALLVNDVVIIPASFPKTRALLERRGFQVRTIDVSELQKAEAGVTCTSLIFEDETLSAVGTPE